MARSSTGAAPLGSTMTEAPAARREPCGDPDLALANQKAAETSMSVATPGRMARTSLRAREVSLAGDDRRAASAYGHGRGDAARGDILLAGTSSGCRTSVVVV